MEGFAIIAKGFKSLTFVPKLSILDVSGGLDYAPGDVLKLIYSNLAKDEKVNTTFNLL